MTAFDYFIALDGNCLNGFEGLAGVARLSCDPARDRWDIDVRYFDGLAGGHALQLSPGGTVGFLGNLSQTLLFFEPRTLREIRRLSTLRFAVPDTFYSSQTHVVWTSERSFITVLGPDFYRFDLDDLERPERLGPHGVTLPHALKRSASGQYLFYGAMDHDRAGYANQAGVFDLKTGTPRVVGLPATVWHLGAHPTRDVFYAPTQRCAPQGHGEFCEYTIAHFKNYLFEIDGPSASVTRHLSIPKDWPGALTSDVVVTETHVLYNACASGALIEVDLETLTQLRFIDERPGPLAALKGWRTAANNVIESFARTDVPGNTHVLLKALRATRFSAIDGSYGLGRSPDGRFLLSAHRGLNEVIVYAYPSFEVVKRIPFPSIQEVLSQRLGRFADTRLGFHHAAVSTTTALPAG
ncbi:MAG: hypothetical protein IPM79_16155 [Polyangiaceae bacterium]|jgi:hypothetical protein|nr:hypothetical protein [Polyangiaceae bacterium]